MKLHIDESPALNHPAHGPMPARLPCVVLTEEETERFVSGEPGADARRCLLLNEATDLVARIQPPPAEVFVYDPHGEVFTTIVPGYRFISSEMTRMG